MPWLQYLKSKGHKIALVDPHISSVCVPFADIHLQYDARDSEGILTAVKNQNLLIEFVTSDQTDVSTLTVAELSQHLGTRGNSVEAVGRFTNKAINREFVSSVDPKHVPAFKSVQCVNDIYDFMKHVNSDIIIKPVDAQSSRGISRITLIDNNQAVEDALNNAFGQTRLDYIIAEQFVIGTELTVEGLMTPGRHHTLAVSSKKHFRTGIASELRYPAALSTDLKDKLEQFHNNIIEKSGLTYGITHAEYIISDNNFYLVEMACRGGGSLIPSDIVPFVSGVDVYGTFYELQQGKTPQLVPDKRQKHAVLYFFEYPSGLVVDVKGLEKASQLPGIQSLELEFKCGDIIKSAGDDRSRQGYTIVFADSEHELEERLQRLINILEVRINEEVKAA